MWLVDVQTQQLQCYEADIPEYAILSHRWGSEELNFKEVSKQRIDKAKKGYPKLEQACRAAISHQLSYLWIDTCCIDKRSSAELSEAVNSMFGWYKNAKVCLAYLEDIASNEVDDTFGNSVWFTRAWTLQELIAPGNLVFYNKDWIELATKVSAATRIEEITGIPDSILQSSDGLWACNFCQKMSWAAGRQATRPEDIAYSLMGLFDVHMPLLYGEGKRAFTRLQEEIVRNTNTLLFLLWGLEQKTYELFAKCPDDFAFARKNVPQAEDHNQLFNLTNLGLEMEMELVRPGLGLYGIVLATNRKANAIHVLVLGRDLYLQYAFQKICVAKLPYTSCVYSEMSKVRLMRGTREQDLGRNARRLGNWGQDYNFVGRAYDLRIYHARPFSLTPVFPKRYDEWSFNDDVQWEPTKKTDPLVAKWSEPMRLGPARMVCQLRPSWELLLEFFFDFDSRPCLLVQRRIAKRTLVALPGRMSLQEVSRTNPDSHKLTLPWTGLWKENQVTKIEGADPSLFWIRGSKWGKTYHKLPPELVPEDESIWISFTGIGILPTGFKPCKRRTDPFVMEILDTAPREFKKAF